MENAGAADAVAKADADLEFLGLEIRGQSAVQVLAVGPGIRLTGRNEVRVSDHGLLTLDGGVVSSLRWVDIRPGGTLQGSGEIEASLYNQGTVSVPSGSKDTVLVVQSDYVGLDNSILDFSFGDKGHSQLVVQGDARLAGELTVTVAQGCSVPAGTSFTVLKAGKITGAFANADHQVVADNGVRFDIGYTAASVTLTAR